MQIRSRSLKARTAAFAMSCAALGACAHNAPAPAKVATVATPAPATEIPASEPSSAAATSAPARDSSGAPASNMLTHFVVMTYARDAVIMGDLEGVRQALNVLAKGDQPEFEHAGAQAWLDKIHAAADPGTTAKTVDEAAQSVANTANVCGQCHAQSGGGPAFPESQEASATPDAPNTLGNRMRRHVWAANRMWEGITGPSDRAWQAGATELASVPTSAPKERPVLEPQFVRELKSLRALGDRARNTSDGAERSRFYAIFLTTCAKCHQRELRSP